MARLMKTWVREEGHGREIAFPLVDVRGDRDGPTVALLAGMHAGEYAGMLALGRLIRTLSRRSAPRVTGRVLIIPVMSMEAVFQRNMQLSPIDQHELHYVWPGHPERSYSEQLIDMVYRTVRIADVFVDMHAGEFTQQVKGWVGGPWEEDGEAWDRVLELTRCFDIPIVDKRAVAETPLALPRALLADGVLNMWTEIGTNGIPTARDVRLQYEGAVNVLRQVGAIPGTPIAHEQRVVGPRHWSILAEQNGMWRPRVRAGQSVREGQVLGVLADVFGERLHTFRSPATALVEFVVTSPAINVDRRPHGYDWHRHLIQLVEDPLLDEDLARSV
jgi:predicted deacylase